MSAADDTDDFDLPAVERDDIATGAAADSADWDERHEGLPRLLRYAMLVNDNAHHVEQRLMAEIDQLCPNLPLNVAWASAFNAGAGLALAAELDRRAVTEDDPKLRGLADCVRLLCLPAPRGGAFFEDHQRVAKALLLAFRTIVHKSSEQLRCEVEQFVFGWAALPACSHMIVRHNSAATNALFIGSRMAEHRIAAAEEAARREQEEEDQAREEAEKETADILHQVAFSAEVVPNHHLVVARLTDEQMKNAKLRDIIGPLRSVINAPLPLVQVPLLHEVRNILMLEFPYAVEVIDSVLADLVGRTTIRLNPVLLLGKSGGGKTFFVRKLSQALGLPSIWSTDCSRADGAVFGGTDRRWHTAEPCHPFLAVAQAKVGNPMVLLDELEKAGTRSDYGRLWDCLLAFLEPETNCRYPDPALQVSLALNEISYIATANTLDPLPTPIRDRFRVVTFPNPGADDLDALLPAVMADLASDRGLDREWVLPLDGTEHAAVARHWRGGSVRRLRRIVDAILRNRDLHATRN
jgi:hypothetical protein